MIRSIIIDEAFENREKLTNLIGKHCDNIEVIATVGSVKAGIAAINRHKPDLIFLDIEMPNGTGFDLLESIKNLNFELIFTTNYDQYDIHDQYAIAIKAIKFCALDYLLKPIDTAELKSAIKKVEERQGKKKKKERNLIIFDNEKL